MAQAGTLSAREGRDRDVVVFKVWTSLPYGPRMALSFGLIAGGLLLQALLVDPHRILSGFVPGAVLLLAGNLLLLVRGYHNKVDYGKWDPTAEWETVDRKKLSQLVRMDQQIRKWDRSVLDITNGLGAFVFVLVAASLGALVLYSSGLVRVVCLDAILLLVPHWVTGVRSILVFPKLVIKVKEIQGLLDRNEAALQGHDVDILMLLNGTEARVPEDVKLRIGIAGHHKDFLGLYGQVVTNDVQGTSYPYCYFVLVARRGYGLAEAFEAYDPPRKVTKEFKRQDEVEVIVIRQHTTKQSGYHTKPRAIDTLFRESFALAAKLAVKN